MLPLIDNTGKITISATEYGTHTYTLTPPPGQYIVFRSIDLAFSTSFQSNGRYSIRLRGQAVTNQGAPDEEVQPIVSTQTIPFELGEAYLEPGEELVIDFRDAGGSGAGDVQTQVIGVKMTSEEWDRRFGGGRV